MDVADCTGIAGVSLLLLAFFLSALGKLKTDTAVYTMMNFTGAVLAGIASFLIKYYPFVILESIWAAVALAGFIKLTAGKRNRLTEKSK
ncbi:MAG: hypothetical protein GXO83_06570 [Chlorobi bacterium]|nr:hypothetical protein [Chlorobiota bacterium]